jgi:hypothetical protein
MSCAYQVAPAELSPTAFQPVSAGGSHALQKPNVNRQDSFAAKEMDIALNNDVGGLEVHGQGSRNVRVNVSGLALCRTEKTQTRPDLPASFSPPSHDPSTTPSTTDSV